MDSQLDNLGNVGKTFLTNYISLTRLRDYQGCEYHRTWSDWKIGSWSIRAFQCQIFKLLPILNILLHSCTICKMRELRLFSVQNVKINEVFEITHSHTELILGQANLKEHEQRWSSLLLAPRNDLISIHPSKFNCPTWAHHTMVALDYTTMLSLFNAQNRR